MFRVVVSRFTVVYIFFSCVFWIVFFMSCWVLLFILVSWIGLSRINLILVWELKGNIFWNLFFYIGFIYFWCKMVFVEVFFLILIFCLLVERNGEYFSIFIMIEYAGSILVIIVCLDIIIYVGCFYIFFSVIYLLFLGLLVFFEMVFKGGLK